MKKLFLFCLVTTIFLGCCDCANFTITSPTFTRPTKIYPANFPLGKQFDQLQEGQKIWIAIDPKGKIVGVDTVIQPEMNYYIDHSGMFSESDDTVRVRFEQATVVREKDIF